MWDLKKKNEVIINFVGIVPTVELLFAMYAQLAIARTV